MEIKNRKIYFWKLAGQNGMRGTGTAKLFSAGRDTNYKDERGGTCIYPIFQIWSSFEQAMDHSGKFKSVRVL